MSDKTRILVVENEMPLAMMMVSALSQAGCEVSVATKGKKGMELAQEEKFDLVVLAASLPDMEGFRLCCELKQRHISRHVPIVFIVGQLNEEERRLGLELGAVDFIEKPFNAREFISRISSRVNDSPARRELSLSDVFDERADADTESFCKAT